MVIVRSRKEFLKREISVWSIRKSVEDRRYARVHPAVMPVEVALNILELTLKEPVNQRWVLDPMVGIGSVPVAALRLGANAFGLDISGEFVRIARERIRDEYRTHPFPSDEKKPTAKIMRGDAKFLDRLVGDRRFHVCVTSPPYFAIMHGRQTFTKGIGRPYSARDADVGNIFDYGEFLRSLRIIYSRVFDVLTEGGWFVPVVGDVNILKTNFPEDTWNKINRGGGGHIFFPVHVDVVNMLRDVGFSIHGIIDWDRRQDYNYLHSIGWNKEDSKRWFMTIRVNENIIFAHKPQT